MSQKKIEILISILIFTYLIILINFFHTDFFYNIPSEVLSEILQKNKFLNFLLILILAIFSHIFVKLFIRMKYNPTTTFLIVLLIGIFLRFFMINGNYTFVFDSYEILTGATEIIAFGNYSYEYRSPPGASIAIIPFLILGRSEFLGQIGIGLYSCLSLVVSYMFIREFYMNDNKIPLIFPFLVAINPMFVFLSRVLTYEPIILFIVASLFYLILKYKTSKSFFVLVLILILAVFIITIRTPYIIITGITVIYLLYLNSNRSSFYAPLIDKRNAFIILFLILSLLLYFTFFAHSEFEKTHTGARGKISTENLKNNLGSTIYLVTSPINTIYRAIYFRSNYDNGDIIKFNTYSSVFQILFMLIGLIACLRQRLTFTLYLFAIMTSTTLLYLLYEGWQARYFTLVIFIELIFISAGVISFQEHISKSRKKSKLLTTFYVILIISVIVSFAGDLEGIFIWNTNESKTFNGGAQIEPNELKNIIYLAKNNNVDQIFTSYAASLRFYTYQSAQEISIFDVYKFSTEHDINRTSLAFLHDNISSRVQAGEKVWYVAGWPELDGHNPGLSMGFKELFKSLNDEFILKEIFSGKKVPRRSSNINSPYYKVYEMKK